MTEKMSVTAFRQAQRDAWSRQEFTDAVVALFQEHGWLVHHDRPARTEKRWRTAVQGDAGFPDIVAAKDGRVVFAELKREKGRLSFHQSRWLDELGSPHLVWRPSDWPAIERIAQGV